MAVDSRTGVAVGQPHWDVGSSEPRNKFHIMNTKTSMGTAYRHEMNNQSQYSQPRGVHGVHDPSKKVVHTAPHTTSPNKVITGPAGLARSGPLYAGTKSSALKEKAPLKKKTAVKANNNNNSSSSNSNSNNVKGKGAMHTIPSASATGNRQSSTVSVNLSLGNLSLHSPLHSPKTSP